MDALWVLVAGFAGGVLTSTVGVASLLTFPVLVAVGLPPVTANVSNTIGLVPAGLGAAAGFRDELRAHPRLAAQLLCLTAVAGIGGAALLVLLPAGVFEAIVPWLILGTCVLVALQPRIAAWLRHRRGEDGEARIRLTPLVVGCVLLVGVYGGYFGAGAGVMMLAVLALSFDIELHVAGALRTLTVMAANITAGVVFALTADVDWGVVGLLAVGSVLGGYVGARIAKRLPATCLRVAIVVAGTGSAVAMLL
ncbi:sulfite exporter TauE/SafE family protein [Nocardioides zeae]|uniref:Probable membrane transporter protein n=1 Tax=Nocardioides zeae TaxID=1457234 RepID=A0AAJ1X2L1_9ACTN|nr:sulfite exporter TauE/SafE family protein [Nocardioides zeae]MDQ1105981.1 putative membrane protein YfcA [Nocardioides zeae]